MKTKKLLSVLLAFVMVLGLVTPFSLSAFADDAGADGDKTVADKTQERVTITNGDYSLSVNKTVFEVGEEILVTASGPHSKDWVGFYKWNQDGSWFWKYVDGMGDGVETNFIAGQNVPEGEYVIRLQAKDSSNFEDSKALVKIKVGNPKTGVRGDDSLLSVDKTVYASGEPIMVTAPAINSDSWIGIYTFGSYGKKSTAWHWINNPNKAGNELNSGEGVEFDVTQGKELAPGAYMIYLFPHSATDMNAVLASVSVTVTGDGVVTYETLLGEAGGDTDEPENPEGGGDTPVDPTPDPEPDPDEPDVGGGEITGGQDEVAVSNETHSLSVNKTRYEVGEEILVTAVGVGSKDWIGIAERDSRDATIRWYYVASAGNGVPYDIKTAPNVGGNLSYLKDIPEGLYTIYLVENDKYLKDGFTFSINIAVGSVDDTENGKTEGGTNAEPDAPSITQAPISATYTPSVDGFAGGTVSVTMPYGITSGYDIVMFWADENGALDGYTSLAKFKVTAETTTFTFDKNTVVPSGATKLLVYAKKSDESALSTGYVTVELPSGAAMDSLGTPTLSMVVISDIHISGLADVSAVNFTKMIKDVISLHPNGVAIYIVGDIADNGQAAQYANAITLYEGAINEMGAQAEKYPMFFAIGNHDYPAASGAFLEYATLPNGTHPTDTSYDFWLNGYHYIFLGSDTPSGLGAYLNADTLAWLDSKLAENRDPSRPTFVFLHQSLYNTVAGSLPGEGWHGVSNDSELRAVLAKYPEIMFFNGHSHWTMDSVSNMYGATEELPIHAFNCASVSYLWSGYNKVTGEHLDGSQGYIVEIYGNQIFVRGRDFSTGEWVASAQYLVTLPECEHSYEITEIKYENGYLLSGTATKVCACGATVVEAAPALATFKGYSVAEYGVSSVVVSYSVNYEQIELYERVMNTKIELGVVACASSNLVNKDNKPIKADGTSAEVSAGVIANSKIDNTLATVSIIMKTASWEKYADLEMVMCMYLIENGNVSYACADTLTEAAVPVTYNGILSGKEEEK